MQPAFGSPSHPSSLLRTLLVTSTLHKDVEFRSALVSVVYVNVHWCYALTHPECVSVNSHRHCSSSSWFYQHAQQNWSANTDAVAHVFTTVFCFTMGRCMISYVVWTRHPYGPNLDAFILRVNAGIRMTTPYLPVQPTVSSERSHSRDPYLLVRTTVIQHFQYPSCTVLTPVWQRTSSQVSGLLCFCFNFR